MSERAAGSRPGASRSFSACCFSCTSVIATVRGGSALLPGDLFLRFDPLAALAAQIGGRQFIWRLLPAVVTLAAGLCRGAGLVRLDLPAGYDAGLRDAGAAGAARLTSRRHRLRSIKYFLLFARLWPALCSAT